MFVCIKLKKVYIARHHHVSRSFVFTPQKVVRTASFYSKLYCLIEAFGLCPKVQAPFSYRRDLAYTTQHIKCSLSPPLPLTFFVFYGAPLLLTHIRVCSRTSVVLLPRFLCFPTRYIIEVAFHPVHPVHPVQPILARTCFFYVATRLTLVHYERSTFIRFLQAQPHILLFIHKCTMYICNMNIFS